MVGSVGHFVEVYVATSLEECARRDVKGLYAKAFSGEIKEFTGVSDPYEAPDHAEVVVETEGRTPEDSAAVRARASSSGWASSPRCSRRPSPDGVLHDRARKNDGLIAPHGGELVDRTVIGDEAAALRERGRGPADAPLTEKQTADLDMIASGALSPLTGFMGQADYDRVVDDMHLETGLPWAMPVTLSAPESPTADRLALEGHDGDLLAVIDVAEVYRGRPQRGGRQGLPHHRRGPSRRRPDLRRGQRSSSAGRSPCSSGRSRPSPKLHVDPAETRAAFAERGWSRVVGFQTRNPVHRAHEYIQKCALETVDGLLLHPLVGKTKGDDVPAEVRVRCYEVLLEKYYPADRTMLSAFPAAMRYAGPREAVWHAICRKNYGCSHFIVGRDHAGVGSYYGTYDAHLIFDEFEPHELDIEPMFFDHTFFCRTLREHGLGEDLPAPRRGPRLPLGDEGARDARPAARCRRSSSAGPRWPQVLIEAYRSLAIAREGRAPCELRRGGHLYSPQALLDLSGDAES